MKKRLTMILAGLFLMVGMASAQTRVTGVVVDEFNEPVMGATVKVVGSNATALTDVDGNFSIQAPSDKSSLTISYIGYTTQTVKAGKNLTITLETDNTELEQVVVVGYGSARKVGSITGQVATVQSDKLKNTPSASALEALQGQVAGLAVVNSSGVAGDNAASITIHGIGSLGASTAPLYVLDGIPTTSRAIYAMNPNDIQSITVLKDASATSIYGSRAANGVIYVTTKGGSYNTKSTVTVRSQYGWNTLADKSLYEDMMSSQELYNFWNASGFPQAYYGPNYSTDWLMDYFGWSLDNNTDWYNYFQNMYTHQYQNDVTIEGGSDKISYLIGGSQFHQQGMAIGNDYDRYTVRSNINAKPKSWMKTGFNFNFSYDRKTTNANWGDSSDNSNYLSGGLSYLINPMEAARDEYGNVYPYQFPNGFWNPKYSDSQQHRYTDRYGFTGNFFVEITPFKGMKLTSRVGDDMYFYEYEYNSIIGNRYAKASRSRDHEYGYTATITNTAEYSFDLFEDHHFTFLAGQEGVKEFANDFNASSSGIDSNKLVNLQNGLQSTYSMKESKSEAHFLSFFGRMNYNLLDRYFIDASIRSDECSRFGANKRQATFWSVGGLWKIKSEKFLENTKWINDLDFKASYGTSGNAGIGNYSALGRVGTLTNYAEGQSWAMGIMPNRDLTWETQKLLTVGLSGKLFNFFDFDVSWYLRRTEDMLMDVPYGYYTGISEATSNVGALENKGFDVRVGFDILRGKDYYFNASLNFNYNWQKITKLFRGLNRWEIANTGLCYVVGDPVSFYYPMWAGVNPENGAPQWFVPGENIDVTTTDPNNVTENFDSAALTQNTGKKKYAPFNGGFSLNAGWKGLSIAADFTVQMGRYLINNDEFFYANPFIVGMSYTQHKMVNDFWTPEHTNARFPDWSQGYTMEFDTHLLQSSDFLRLKSLRIGYDLPKSVIGFQNAVKNVKLTFTGRNLFTITPYNGLDPEVASNLTLGKASNTKQYLFGLEVTF